MSIYDVMFQEKLNTGTAPTNNLQFEKDGYLVIKNLWDPKELYCKPPEIKGRYDYHPNGSFTYHEIENQVNGSTARYNYPEYKYIHTQIRLKLEKIIGKKLYNTYYFDRFYNPEQRLEIHADRPSCEISVTLHISKNFDVDWPIWIKTPDVYDDPIEKNIIIKEGEKRSALLNPGDGMIYKGCERPHWRDPLPGEKRNKIRKLFKREELYYHQIFFHYVLSDGYRANHAWDRN